jgi:hypothetical protein
VRILDGRSFADRRHLPISAVYRNSQVNLSPPRQPFLSYCLAMASDPVYLVFATESVASCTGQINSFVFDASYCSADNLCNLCVRRRLALPCQ